MRELTDTKINSLAKSVDLDQEDITRIKSSKRSGFLEKINPVYWFSQVLIFLISLFYSVIIGAAKQAATYPFDSNRQTVLLAPFPLSAHIINAIYSLTGKERSGFSRRARFFVFFVNFSLFVSAFYFYYLAIPKVYQSNVLYGVFDAEGSRKASVDLRI